MSMAHLDACIEKIGSLNDRGVRADGSFRLIFDCVNFAFSFCIMA